LGCAGHFEHILQDTLDHGSAGFAVFMSGQDPLANRSLH
jgi:hypothetical protein